jgi:hypothetical protein
VVAGKTRAQHAACTSRPRWGASLLLINTLLCTPTLSPTTIRRESYQGLLRKYSIDAAGLPW